MRWLVRWRSRRERTVVVEMVAEEHVDLLITEFHDAGIYLIEEIEERAWVEYDARESVRCEALQRKLMHEGLSAQRQVSPFGAFSQQGAAQDQRTALGLRGAGGLGALLGGVGAAVGLGLGALFGGHTAEQEYNTRRRDESGYY